MKAKYYIKIYGERNSGTKYLEQLISKNLDCHILRGTEPQSIYQLHCEWLNDLFFYVREREFLGWKHSTPLIKNISHFNNNNRLLILTITKNPYAYLLSLFDRPHHIKGRKPTIFQEFISNPWITRYRDHCQKQLNNPIQLWNVKNKSYLDLNNKVEEVINIAYEKLIANPEKYINIISSKFKIKKYNGFQHILNNTNNDSNKSYKDLRDYYLEEKWKKRLSIKNIDTINESLCMDIAKYFSYKPL